MNGDEKKEDPDIARKQVTRNWWLMALRGLAAIAFGVLAFIWPGLTILSLVLLFGTFAVVNGTLALVQGYKAPRGYPRMGSLTFEGIISIVAGLVAFIVPGITALAFLVLIAAWAITNGIIEIVAAVRLRKTIRHEWLLALAGIASLAFGVILLLAPLAGALVLVWWIAAFAMVFGVLLMVLAFRMRRGKGFAAPEIAAV